MSFTIKIALQPFEVAFEAGSIAEAVAILSDPQNEIGKLAALAAGTNTESSVAEEAAPVADAPKRGRKKNQPDPATAVAPPPAPVGDAPPPPPVPSAPDLTLPAAVAPLAPPPVMAPPPVVAPPVTKLADKVVAVLKDKAASAADQGAALVTWLAQAQLVVPGVTFTEAMDCLLFFDDAKIKPVADALGVA